MKRLILFAVLSNIVLLSFAQIKKQKGMIGISIPIVYNKSEGVQYINSTEKIANGKSAVSYGVNISYLQPVTKGFFVKIESGFYKQVFNIHKSFKYNPNDSFITGLVYSTEVYDYSNFSIGGGIGYKRNINEKIAIRALFSYKSLLSFRQKYILNRNNKFWQIENKSFSIGNIISTELGLDKQVSKRISLYAGIVIQGLTRWNIDETFIGIRRPDEEKRIAYNKFSGGLVLAAYYHF